MLVGRLRRLVELRWRARVFCLMASPVLLALVLVKLDLNLSPEASLVYLAFVFAGTAGLAVIVSALLAVMGWKAWVAAGRNFGPEDSRRLIAIVNVLVNTSLLIVHLMFLGVGLGSVFLEQDSVLRLEISRVGLVVGQWVLLMAGLSSHLIHRRIRRLLADEMSFKERVDASIVTDREEAGDAEEVRERLDAAEARITTEGEEVRERLLEAEVRGREERSAIEDKVNEVLDLLKGQSEVR